MNEREQWLQSNDDYLRDAMHWVQLRLQRQIDSVAPVKIPEPVKNHWFKPNTDEAATQQDESAKTAVLALAAERMASAEAVNPPPALIILSQQLGLTRFEREVLLLCVAMELDGSTAALCAKAHGKPYPTFALAAQIFDEHKWDAISAERPLRYWRLLEINQPGAEPLTTSALRADERIVNYIIEPKHIVDDRLMPFISTIEATAQDEDALAPSQRLAAEMLRHYLAANQADAGQRALIIQLTGTDASAKQAVASQALAGFGLQITRFAVDSLPAQTAELENLIRLWGRERQLLPIALYLDAHGLDETAAHAGAVQRLVKNVGGIVIIATRELRAELGGWSLEISKPTSAEQQLAWNAALGGNENTTAARLAGQFNLDVLAIQQIARAELADISAKPDSLPTRLWQACLLKTTPSLDQLAQRIDAKATWKNLVLPQEALTILQQIVNQVDQRGKVYNDWGFLAKMNRGLGLSVLFAGESGTGKTMAAEVLANALQLHLYRIDLSSVVSKYIGETEKNLRRLFDAAEDGGAVLFFDEADALFGKRSEVKDSHDRYANIEINYLLQRIEAYRGLAILATNMKSSLDQAFMRRLRFIVNFPFPGLPERKEMWRKVFPSDVPKAAELDYERLARFNLTGGSIQNIALNAAFLAAAQSDSEAIVTLPLIYDAIRSELRKLDKPVNEAEFRILDVVGAKS
ncbi:MAG: ATP-binding protein [Methylococcaceae bacterium]|nr:ATP-binding protein [Methylococcaceae bacterium]MDP2392051.1 ATP-binding protein [Methylococcaceae bacterium]MDP3020955.1 ATP-binding protein [Methylococcaceae bacterium]MDP3391168.1 ATP-binding protein [Methylococcaceae bacterium]MDP3931711.1 ATP-binding protein [Methylococcaceae bacterium]